MTVFSSIAPPTPGGPLAVSGSSGSGSGSGSPTASEGLLTAARAYEAAFLTEMLKHSGLGEAPEGFGGGIGEEQFASMMHRAQAEKIVEAGGIGLAEYIVRALQEQQV